MVSESSDRERAGERDSRDCCEGERWEGDGEWEWGWEWRGDSGAWEGSSGSSERCEDALRDEGCRAGRLAMAALSLGRCKKTVLFNTQMVEVARIRLEASC